MEKNNGQDEIVAKVAKTQEGITHTFCSPEAPINCKKIQEFIARCDPQVDTIF